MIHLCARSPFAGAGAAVLYGKGPSLDKRFSVPGAAHIGINEAAIIALPTWGIVRDWTVLGRITGADRVSPHWIVSHKAWVLRDNRWVQRPPNLYFNGRLVLGRDVASKVVPGKNLGVGTATVALQLLAEAGVKTVYLNGFDNFWGDENPEYHESFKKMGLDPADYAKAFPVSGTVEEQRRLVRESMQYVIAQKGLEVRDAALHKVL